MQLEQPRSSEYSKLETSEGPNGGKLEHLGAFLSGKQEQSEEPQYSQIPDSISFMKLDQKPEYVPQSASSFPNVCDKHPVNSHLFDYLEQKQGLL